MKAVLVILLSLTLATQALAAGAMEYSCMGVNKIDGKYIEFDVTYSDYAREAGFTNQSVSISKVGNIEPQNFKTLQMFGATKDNACQVVGTESSDELYLNKDNFSMTDAHQGAEYDSIVTLQSGCIGHELNVVGVCSLN